MGNVKRRGRERKDMEGRLQKWYKGKGKKGKSINGKHWETMWKIERERQEGMPRHRKETEKQIFTPTCDSSSFTTRQMYTEIQSSTLYYTPPHTHLLPHTVLLTVIQHNIPFSGTAFQVIFSMFSRQHIQVHTCWREQLALTSVAACCGGYLPRCLSASPACNLAIASTSGLE